MRLSPSLLLGSLACLCCTPTLRADKKEAIDFNRQIRPILSDNCFTCHGPDASQRKARLRLDTREGALAELRGGGRAIVPGKPDESELLDRITAPEPDRLMPPPKGNKRLTTEQIALLRQWIEQGAKWSEHWAFVPPVRPELPRVKNEVWCRNPIDYFILARLEKERLKPAPEADRVTLIRRLSLDLIGLPPTIEEVDTFVNDQSERAYEKVVDRLLASPHYGERWGRQWLDAARYADSDGFEKDMARKVWFYRDWVINAFNRDLPYDRFIIEQIAGDLLPGAKQDQIVATGYLRNSMTNEEGGIDPEQFRVEALFDRMDAIGKGILGMTMQCAQCHDHKYDPLKQLDYYRMMAFLNNDYEANIAVYTPAEQWQRASIFRQIREIENDLRHKHPDWRERMHAWEDKVRNDQPEWILLQPQVDLISTVGQKYLALEDGSLLAQGYAPTKMKLLLTARTDVRNITAFRLELLNDPRLPMGGPGRSVRGTCMLTEFEVEARPAGAVQEAKAAKAKVDKPTAPVRDDNTLPDEPEATQLPKSPTGGGFKKIKLVKATADFNPPEQPFLAADDVGVEEDRIIGPIHFAIDGKPETAWSIDAGPGRRNQPRKAVFVTEKPIGYAEGTELNFYLTQTHRGPRWEENRTQALGRFRLSITTHPNAEADPLPVRVREIISKPRDARSPAEEAVVFSYWRTTVPEWKAANDRIEALWQTHPEGTTQLVLQAQGQPRETYLLKRGDFLCPGDKVSPGVPAFMHPLPTKPSGQEAPRLTFAKWLVDPKSPTTARAAVNRIWQGYFGTGLVATSEDLGTQSEPPSHPELLDWLATEFMAAGGSKAPAWSMKKLHRLIVTSATYRQSSRLTPELLRLDPNNRLLARGPRFRVDAEVVRDVALAASGLLHPTIGGRSSYPPLPEFMTKKPIVFQPKIWPEDKGPERYRRSIYTFRYRSIPYPVLQTFDAPNGEFACVRRARSNTPLQSLTTLNEPLFMECARALALRTLKEGGATDAERIEFAFRCCLARKPAEKEAAELLTLLDKQQQRFAKPDAKPMDLLGQKADAEMKLPDGVTPAQAAAWTLVSRVLLNLDETITKE